MSSSGGTFSCAKHPMTYWRSDRLSIKPTMLGREGRASSRPALACVGILFPAPAENVACDPPDVIVKCAPAGIAPETGSIAAYPTLQR